MGPQIKKGDYVYSENYDPMTRLEGRALVKINKVIPMYCGSMNRYKFTYIYKDGIFRDDQKYSEFDEDTDFHNSSIVGPLEDLKAFIL